MSERDALYDMLAGQPAVQHMACREDCSRPLLCGHSCTKRCHAKGEPSLYTCPVAMSKRHAMTVRHAAEATAGCVCADKADVQHAACKEDCSRPLLCGHSCTKRCHAKSESCSGCSKRCQVRCVHGHCSQACSEVSLILNTTSAQTCLIVQSQHALACETFQLHAAILCRLNVHYTCVPSAAHDPGMLGRTARTELVPEQAAKLGIVGRHACHAWSSVWHQAVPCHAVHLWYTHGLEIPRCSLCRPLAQSAGCRHVCPAWSPALHLAASCHAARPARTCQAPSLQSRLSRPLQHCIVCTQHGDHALFAGVCALPGALRGARLLPAMQRALRAPRQPRARDHCEKLI